MVKQKKIVWFKEVDKDDVALVGGKGANLGEMAQAGFRLLLFGVESASQKTINRLNKNIKVKQIEKELKIIKEVNRQEKGRLEPHLTFMIGYPWESKKDAQRTIDLAKDLFKKGYVDTLQATIVIPYPGTPLYKYCQENDLLNFRDYNRFDQREQVMKSELSTDDVKELTQDLYKSFITPKFILRKFLNIRNWDDIKFLRRAGWKVLGHLADFSRKSARRCRIASRTPPASPALTIFT